MAQLRTDYKDDILDISVNTERKYRQVENADGTITLVDETVYTQKGDSFGAADVNAITGNLTAENGTSFQFSYDSESGKYGYIAKVEGADTFRPFSGLDSLNLFNSKVLEGSFSDANFVNHEVTDSLTLNSNESYVIPITLSMVYDGGGSVGSNIRCEWNSVQFPEKAEFDLIYESNKSGMQLFRLYKVNTKDAGNLVVKVGVNGYYAKHYKLQIVAVSA